MLINHTICDFHWQLYCLCQIRTEQVWNPHYIMRPLTVTSRSAGSHSNWWNMLLVYATAQEWICGFNAAATVKCDTNRSLEIMVPGGSWDARIIYTEENTCEQIYLTTSLFKAIHTLTPLSHNWHTNSGFKAHSLTHTRHIAVAAKPEERLHTVQRGRMCTEQCRELL